ncbi:hypothetical protein ABC383_22985 [Noviherbaspirillum sp. 1P10PC]|uniref:type IV pilus assembly protein FimV n=1 Tax=Noviherbaspirillum sp. 1P10PC TaxID=3132292 RepID=UPI0039A28809
MMQFALKKFWPRPVALFLAFSSTQADALGLGPITLSSKLGHPLQAQVAVYGLGAEELKANCLTTRVTALDGNLLSKPSSQLIVKGSGATINIAGRERLSEPVVNIAVEVNCESTIRRDYQILLDPDQEMQSVSAKSQQPRLPDVEPPSAVQNKSSRLTSAAAPVASGVLGPGKTPKIPRAKQAPAARSLLTLSTANTGPEQAQPYLTLRHATTLSEPLGEADKAKPTPLDADQTRVPEPVSGEDPTSLIRGQLRDAQRELRLATQSAVSLRQELKKEKAAMAAERKSLVSSEWLALLAALLTASVAIALWLWRCRVEDKRRYQNELLILTSAFDTQAQTDPPAPPSVPKASMVHVEDQSPSAAVSFPAERASNATPSTMLDWEDKSSVSAFASAPPQPGSPTLEWDLEPTGPVAAAAAPAAPDTTFPLLTTEQADDGMQDRHIALPELILPAVSESAAQTHADEVADMLLAAERWMMEHSPLRAAEPLRPYLERQDMLSPAPGLYLIALYQTAGDQEQIKALQARMSRYFPEATKYWQPDARPRLTLASFPDVVETIDALAQTSALLPYLKGLLLAPHKFDFSAYREIVRAIAAAEETEKLSTASQFG